MLIRKKLHAEINSKWQRKLEESTVLTFLILILLFYFFPHIDTKTIIREMPQEIVKIEDVVITKQEIKAPPPPPSLARIAITDNNTVVEDIDFTSELNVNAPVAPTHVEIQAQMTVEEEESIFEVVEDNPEPLHGIAAIQQSVEYPEIARKAGVEGLVIIRAAVDKNGNVIKTQVLKGIGAGCDEAAAAAVAKAKFKPGMQRGIPVKVWVALPIRFRLKN